MTKEAQTKSVKHSKSLTLLKPCNPLLRRNSLPEGRQVSRQRKTISKAKVKQLARTDYSKQKEALGQHKKKPHFKRPEKIDSKKTLATRPKKLIFFQSQRNSFTFPLYKYSEKLRISPTLDKLNQMQNDEDNDTEEEVVEKGVEKNHALLLSLIN